MTLSRVRIRMFGSIPAAIIDTEASKKGAVHLECSLEAHDSESAAAMGSGKDIGGVQLPFTYEITAENEFIL